MLQRPTHASKLHNERRGVDNSGHCSRVVPSNGPLLRTPALEVWQLSHVSFVWTLQETVHLSRVSGQIVLVVESIFRVRDLSTLSIRLQGLFPGFLPHRCHFVWTLPGGAAAAWLVGWVVSSRSDGGRGTHGAVFAAHLGVASDIRRVVA